MDELDDFVCDIQSDELFYDSLFELAEDEYLDPENHYSLNAERRKNDWKYAVRRSAIYNWKNSRRPLKKPLHYYAKNPPWNGYAFAPNKTNNKGSRRYISKNYAPVKNWNEHDKRQIDSFENQLKELLEGE